MCILFQQNVLQKDKNVIMLSQEQQQEIISS